MKDQLLCETEREHQEVVESYEEKVQELRISLQNKETVVIATEDKLNQLEEETINPASRVNIGYYNEISGLKVIHDRFALENQQLTYLNTVKDEEIERMKEVMKGIERAMEKKEECRQCREAILGEVAQMGTPNKARKVEARSRLQVELIRYDSKYKALSPIKALTSSQASSLKFLITHLHKENRDIRLQKQKDKQYRMLQESYKCIKAELIIDRIEVQFYRGNFKELSKVPAERRIKFYEEYYAGSLPNLEMRLKEKQQVIAYWKRWEQLTKDINGKWIISRDTNPKHTNKRSHSCPACFCYVAKSPRKKHIASREKEEAISASSMRPITSTPWSITQLMPRIRSSRHPMPSMMIYQSSFSLKSWIRVGKAIKRLNNDRVSIQVLAKIQGRWGLWMNLRYIMIVVQ